MRRQTALYRRLLAIYPSRFRSDYEELMTQMVVDRINMEGSTPRLWMHLIADLLKSALNEHLRSLMGSLRARPISLSASLLVMGAVLGSVVAVSGALSGGFDTGSNGGTESSVWLVVAYSIILLAFTGSLALRGLRGSPLIKLGIVLFAVGQLSVIIHEAHLVNMALPVPTMGAVSAFPVMLGAAAIAAGMSESPNWSRTHVWSTLAVVIVPLVMALGAYPAVLNATGSEISAGLLFRAGYMIIWALVGATFVLARPPSPQTRNRGGP